MQRGLKKRLIDLLKDTADKIEVGTCELSEDEAMDILRTLTHEAISKESACSYLNISRSKFDELVRTKELPKGRKRRGFKELVWYKDELNDYLQK